LNEQALSGATAIERWAFFFLFADRYEPARLRELLPGREFQQAVSAIEVIASKTEDRRMYDQREKAQRDYLWAIHSAREQGRQEGRQEGRLAGKIQLLQQLLGDRVSSDEEPQDRTKEELSSTLADLQERLRSRGD